MLTHENTAGSGEAGGVEISQHDEVFMPTKATEIKEKISEARMKYLARRLHELGERATYELLREVVAGRDPIARLEAFARIDPSILAALGGVALPHMIHLVEGAAQ
ncbi:MAG: hypothetical protein C3F11_03650 [Methylocystaceae bacterium]|nr:MAG: hypothetical protein C3F11_03650 [Methylocystaceae bacterium]